MFICYLLLFVYFSLLFICSQETWPKLWYQFEFSKNPSSVSYIFVYLKPVSLRVLVFLVIYEFTNWEMLIALSEPALHRCSYKKLVLKYAANVQENNRAEV